MKLQNSLEIQNLLLKMLQILLIPTKAEIHTQKYMCFMFHASPLQFFSLFVIALAI